MNPEEVRRLIYEIVGEECINMRPIPTLEDTSVLAQKPFLFTDEDFRSIYGKLRVAFPKVPNIAAQNGFSSKTINIIKRRLATPASMIDLVLTECQSVLVPQ